MLRQEITALWKEHGTAEFRKFGRTMGMFLILLGLILCYFSSQSATWLNALGAMLLILSALSPVLLKPLYSIWMSFATLLGFIMTRIILGAIFFLIFAPVGLVFRLLRKDHLDESIDPRAETYWITRKAVPYEPGMSEKQS